MHIKQLFDLTGRIVVVTGGAGSYGKCIVEGLLEAGATVVVTSRDPRRARLDLQDHFGQQDRLEVMLLDQQIAKSIEAFLGTLKNRYEKIDVLVNNAVARPMRGYAGDIEQFRESMEINATGMFALLRELSNWMADTGGGSVISIASMMGIRGPDYSNYTGTAMGDLPPDYFFHNAGLINLSRFMCKKFAGQQVRFNCISPGGLFNNQPDKFLVNYCEKVPLGRMAKPDDIKGIIVLLASDAGAYINGENILMDGGLNA